VQLSHTGLEVDKHRGFNADGTGHEALCFIDR